MVQTPFFSIVIPVYKAERYLPRCLNGITGQAFSDWELILADDGSPDGSGVLCDRYAAADDRIRVIHKSNGGAASARNAGTLAATGRYILYIDSDDYWEGTDFLRQLSMRLQAGPDLCLFGCYDEYAETGNRVRSRGPYPIKEFAENDKGSILSALVDAHQFPGSCWIMAVRRQLLTENGISFEEGNRAEDIDWLLSVLTAAKTITAIDEPYYIYIKSRADSVTGTANADSVFGILRTITKWQPRLQSTCTGTLYIALNSYLTFMYLTVPAIYEALPAEKRKTVRQTMKNTKPDWNRIRGKRIKLAALLYRTLGIDIYAKLLTLRQKNRG